MTEDNDEKLALEWYDRKTAMMVNVLGEEHDIVMHSLVLRDITILGDRKSIVSTRLARTLLLEG